MKSLWSIGFRMQNKQITISPVEQLNSWTLLFYKGNDCDLVLSFASHLFKSVRVYIIQKQDIYYLTSNISKPKYNSIRNKNLVFDIYVDILVHDIQSLYIYIYTYIYKSIYLPIYLPIYLSIYLSIYLYLKYLEWYGL